MRYLQIKGRIAEVLEGGRVSRENLLNELKSLAETKDLNNNEIIEMLRQMVEDQVVRRLVVEEDGKMVEYLELDE